jgi:hypothetical protein
VKGFARREFQLMLLRRMADFQPGLVEAACAEVEATRKQYLDAHHRWQSMLRSARAPAGLELYQAVLGPPKQERPVRIGDAEVTACSWPLRDLWPDLSWELIVGVGNVAVHGELVRTAAGATPALGRPGELAPWSCVRGDVLQAFAGAEQVDPETPSQWVLRLDGYQMMFVHGLLQTVVALE